jgi:hypothetical protein
MKCDRNLIKLSAALAAVVAMATPAFAQPTSQTPLSSPVEVTGTSGGSRSSSCGNLPETPSHTLRVSESFAAIDISAEAEGSFTLQITSPNGFSECLLSSDGVINAPGVLNQGTYSIYVGSRSGGSYPYTLSIRQD